MAATQHEQSTYKRKGIRRNLTTYFTVRLLQGLALTILFYFYLNTFGERKMEWKWVVLSYPAWSIYGTMMFEAFHCVMVDKKKRK